LEADSLNPAVFSDNLDRVGQISEYYALFISLNDFDFIGGHFVLCPTVDVIYRIRSKPYSGAADVHGGVAAAHHSHIAPFEYKVVLVYIPQKIYAAHHAVQLLARTAQGGAPPCPGGDNDGVIVRAKRRESYILTYFHAVAEDGAQCPDNVNFPLQYSLWQTVFRDAVAEHTAHMRHGVINGDVMALQAQEIGRCQSARPTAYDGDGLARSIPRHGGVKLFGRMRQNRVGGKALQPGDRKRFLHQLPAAGVFAGMGANPADGGGQGQFFHY
jgi:hypothetical protein